MLVILGASLARAQTIVSQKFTSGEKRIELPGTAPDINQPGGLWTKTAGFEWAKPFVPANWDAPALAVNVAAIAENPAGLAIPFSGGDKFVKPSAFTISATLVMTHAEATANNGSVALGFYSVLPAPDTGADTEKLGLVHFTGIRIYQTGAILEGDVAGNGKVELIVDGEVVGTALELAAPFSLNKPFEVSYTVDTASGKVSGLLIDGKNPFPEGKGFSDGKIRDALTAYAAVLSCGGGGARAALSEFSIKTAK